jgi:hypothetical protein
LLYRDCIFFKYVGSPDWRNIASNFNENYCSFVCDTFEEGILQANISWSDPIKVRDKIVTTERKTINFFVFKEQSLICLFGGSESQLAYTISKLMIFFDIKLSKINPFNIYKEQFLKANFNKELVLTSVDIAKEQTGFDDSTYFNVAMSELKLDNLHSYLKSNDIISFIILYNEKQIYFSVDVYGVVSFFDTDGFGYIFEVCKRIVVDIV